MYFLRNVKLFENYAVLGGELTHFYTDPYLHILYFFVSTEIVLCFQIMLQQSRLIYFVHLPTNRVRGNKA
jgi:hypothetical protein